MPTSLSHRSDDGVVDVDGGSNPGIFASLLAPPMPALEPSEAPVTRRFYLEIVALRQATGIQAAQLIADARLAPALAALRGAAGDEPVRIACLVELGPDVDVESLKRARDALAKHDIALDVWPQLPDARARFLNTSTAAQFQERLLPLLDELGLSAAPPSALAPGLALDLEPNEALMRAAWGVRDTERSLVARAKSIGGLVKGLSRAVLDARQGHRDLQELARDLHARKLPVHVAVMPPLTATPGRDALRHWALGCPAVDDDGQPLFSLQGAMCYAGLIRSEREEQKRTLALWAARHRTTFDAVIVGQTSTGILGDEPVYDNPRWLAEDVRAMHALGFVDVGIYALEGILFGKNGMPASSGAGARGTSPRAGARTSPGAGACPRLELRSDVEDWIAAAFGR